MGRSWREKKIVEELLAKNAVEREMDYKPARKTGKKREETKERGNDNKQDLKKRSCCSNFPGRICCCCCVWRDIAEDEAGANTRAKK